MEASPQGVERPDSGSSCSRITWNQSPECGSLGSRQIFMQRCRLKYRLIPGERGSHSPTPLHHPLHPIYSSAALSAGIYSAPSVPPPRPRASPHLPFQGSLYCGIISFCSSPRLEHLRHISDLAWPCSRSFIIT